MRKDMFNSGEKAICLFSVVIEIVLVCLGVYQLIVYPEWLSFIVFCIYVLALIVNSIRYSMLIKRDRKTKGVL